MDDYGRRAHSVYDDNNNGNVCIGRIVRMPVAYADKYGQDKAYLTNDWRMDRGDDNKVQYHGSLAEALNRFTGGAEAEMVDNSSWAG